VRPRDPELDSLFRDEHLDGENGHEDERDAAHGAVETFDLREAELEDENGFTGLLFGPEHAAKRYCAPPAP